MFKIAAHRGGNSIESILKAIEKKYDYVELDVHLSKDGKVIVQYEPIITANGTNCFIEDIEYSKLTFSDKEKLLLFEQVLKIVKGKIGVIVDIKHGLHFYQHIGEKVAFLIKEADMCAESWIISFDHVCLNEAKNTNQAIRIAPMYVARINQEKEYWSSIQSDGVEVCNEYLDINSVKAAHSLGMTMIGWCTKDYDEINDLVKMGIDIITIEAEDEYLNYLKSMRDTVQ